MTLAAALDLPEVVEVEMTEAAIMSGTACDQDNCPLAILLSIRFPGKCVRVNNGVFIYESESDEEADDPLGEYRMDSMTEAFIKSFDNSLEQVAQEALLADLPVNQDDMRDARLTLVEKWVGKKFLFTRLWRNHGRSPLLAT
ncbi:MAG: hypothetical protein OXG44_19365 [Gammaproteobacteria bacterium]|nr:hypothetical protein [Gammaproteobacteria bacterium]